MRTKNVLGHKTELEPETFRSEIGQLKMLLKPIRSGASLKERNSGTERSKSRLRDCSAEKFYSKRRNE